MTGQRMIRGGAFAASVAAALAVTVAAGAARERSALPGTAQQFLQATLVASELSTCLQGARDELYLPGQPPQLHSRVAVDAALRRLDGCGTAPLSRSLDGLRLPPAAALTDGARRRARTDIVTGTAMLRRVVLDARAARTALAREAHGAADGTAVVLAYRSADSGATTAYALADEALALLGHPQSSVG